jgi:hypothetical protein
VTSQLAEVDHPASETPDQIRDRAVSLVEYLLAVRALVDRPARTVPAADAHWLADLPRHHDCVLGADDTGWLRVGRPTPPPAPPVPAPLRPHLAWDGSPESTPALADDGAVAVPDRVALEFGRWYEQHWRPWSREATAAEATRKLHDRLYDLRFRLDLDAARTELVWGHLVLDGTVAGERVHYPLVATPVSIDYDPETTTVSVTPQGPPRLQPDALAGLDDRRVADLLELGGTGGQVDLDLADEDARHTFAARAMRRLGLDPVVVAAAPSAGAARADSPSVVDTGVLFLRPRQRMVRRFLERMRETLVAADPTAVGALANVLAYEPSTLRMPDDDVDGWHGTADRLLMPLATNDAQESIAQRLAAHRSVAVQGPPGTGKTHTIRNLVCHLVAQGRRVLVLAQKEDPLRVLRDGLPEQLQPLCLAILGRSADQLVQLQTAARELSDRAATLDQHTEADRVRQLTDEIAEVEEQLAQAQEQLRAATARDAATYPLEGTDTPAAEVAAWLRRHEDRYGIIPDPVDAGTAPPLDAAEFTTLADLARRVPPADRQAALGSLPAPSRLPPGDTIGNRRDALSDARKAVTALRDAGLVVDGVRQLGPEQADELAAQLRAAADNLARREGDWTDRLGVLLRDPNWQQVWDRHVDACQELLAALTRRTSMLAGRDITVPDQHLTAPRKLLEQLSDIRDRFAVGKKVGRLAGADLSRLAAACQVDGEAIRTVDDLDLVVAAVERIQLRQQLDNRWAEWTERLAVPPQDGSAELWAGTLLSEAADALDWERRRWPGIYAALVWAYPACPRAVDARTAGELAGAMEACGNVFLADRLEAEERATDEWLRGLAADPIASPVTADLLAAWTAADAASWDNAAAEVRRLVALRPDVNRYDELCDRLAEVAPQWAAAIDAGADLPVAGDDTLRAWRWRQAHSWFDEQIASVDTVATSRQIEHCRDRIRRLTHELVVTSAWLQVSLTLDDRRKAALADWTAALRKIGKGTGKSASHWQAAAQRAMAEAVTAVPVWIMSIDRALEQFHGGEPVFDVVIVDEASQADIFALPTLSLARRAVVVGDDQQIGPQLVGVPTDRVNALIRSHLAEVPSAEHFDTESSLYDHAVRRSPQRILLTEHFRCVPPIIEFSSGTYYDGKVQPLRPDRPAGLGEAVRAVAVPDGRRTTVPDLGQVNVPEAEALVEQVAAVVADPAYRGRSLGVVSLLSGSGQAAYLMRRLRERIGADEIERRALRVGDPYTFQGDERDVVFISTVAAAADGDVGAFTKRDFHRRVNVAASRARDQMWLFHSIGVDDLLADDARTKLLAYCQAPRPADDVPVDDPVALEQRCEADLERAVLRRLLAHGVTPVPQYRIGDFRIDFVLAAPDGRRLAIECDGEGYGGPDEFARAMARQAVLERVGNCVFVRLRASVFARDPDAAMAPVFERLEQLRITPDLS